jgi:hypothetical protein
MCHAHYITLLHEAEPKETGVESINPYHDRFKLSMGGNGCEHLARYLESENSPVDFLERGMRVKITILEKQLKVGLLILKKEDSEFPMSVILSMGEKEWERFTGCLQPVISHRKISEVMSKDCNSISPWQHSLGAHTRKE